MNKKYFIILFLFCVQMIYAQNIIPLKLHKPFYIRADTQKIYIGQGPEIFIYSSEDYKLITKFGKAGEGPEEFKLLPEFSPNYDVQSDIIVAASLGKVSLFSKKGKFINEIKVIADQPNQFFRKFKDKFVVEKFRTGSDKIYYNVLYLFDADLNEIKEIFRSKHHFDRSKPFSPIGRGTYIPNFYIYQGKIFVGGEINKGRIHVFDKTGKLLRRIKVKTDEIPFTKTDKKGYFDSYSKYPEQLNRLKKYWKFPEYFPLYENFIVTDNCIYIQTFKRNKEDTKNEVIILSLQGKLIKTVWLPFDEYFDFNPCPYTIQNRKLYQCVENEETEIWELHITEIK